MRKRTFEELEEAGHVRLRYIPDDAINICWIYQNCFDDEYRADILRKLKQDGAWGLVAEMACPCCRTWQQVDSVWGLIGKDDGGYRKDFQETARSCYLDAVKEQRKRK